MIWTTRTKSHWTSLESGFLGIKNLPRIGDVPAKDVLFTSVSANTVNNHWKAYKNGLHGGIRTGQPSETIGMAWVRKKRNGIGSAPDPVSLLIFKKCLHEEQIYQYATRCESGLEMLSISLLFLLQTIYFQSTG